MTAETVCTFEPSLEPCGCCDDCPECVCGIDEVTFTVWDGYEPCP